VPRFGVPRVPKVKISDLWLKCLKCLKSKNQRPITWIPSSSTLTLDTFFRLATGLPTQNDGPRRL
jgi:hypothetical protein